MEFYYIRRKGHKPVKIIKGKPIPDGYLAAHADFYSKPKAKPKPVSTPA